MFGLPRDGSMFPLSLGAILTRTPAWVAVRVARGGPFCSWSEVMIYSAEVA